VIAGGDQPAGRPRAVRIGPLPAMRAVVFDVGETLVDETRAWNEAAAAAGVTPFTLMAAIGALIERGRDHREVWRLLAAPAPGAPSLTTADLYPDALPCLRAARAAGLVVGIAGNQPAGAESRLREAGFDADFIASSAGWGVEKPSAAFFARVVQEAGVPCDQILYVGDRVDNDVVAASAAGLRSAFLRRGPWGHLQAGLPGAGTADLRLASLHELELLMRATDPPGDAEARG